MSKGIQLSSELIENMMRVIAEHDEEVRENGTLGLQYMAAVMGILAADYPGSDSDRMELLEHLAGFTRHVYEDQMRAREQQQQRAPQQPAPAKGRCVPDPDNPAAGVWKAE
ncbi:MAG TPA: hypothetical protein ENJ01_01895 [Gammaproteobacteria bacterium]|nr:hypothetical protein [Gammaproteobacteria bacterium]